MTYRETLDFLYAQLPMYHRIGAAAYKKDLTNTLALCEHLGNPHTRFRSIHVGGTNGKGSVSHMLAAVCSAAGLKTGLYTSPHYKDFRERIKVNGSPIPRNEVVRFVEQNRQAIEHIQPSFFELCVALAFDWFARQRVDIAIVEVGLGGRLDSTNVISPLLSVITNISYDHQHILGHTLPEIAFEKAGIIKPGVPVVVGESHPESAPVFIKKAAETGSPLVFADRHFDVREKYSMGWRSTFYDVFNPPASEAGGKLYLENLEVQAAGPYQTKNIATVLQALEVAGAQLPSLNLYALQHGLMHLRRLTRFIGRWQVIGESPLVLCDSAHNEAGLRLAMERINHFFETDHPHNQPGTRCALHIVTGFVQDKEIDRALALFPPAARYYFAKANIPRGLDARLLREQAATFGLRGRSYASVKNALKAAKKAAAPQDMIVVTGSIFVVAEVL